jgi:hypothetical protein
VEWWSFSLWLQPAGVAADVAENPNRRRNCVVSQANHPFAELPRPLLVAAKAKNSTTQPSRSVLPIHPQGENHPLAWEKSQI